MSKKISYHEKMKHGEKPLLKYLDETVNCEEE